MRRIKVPWDELGGMWLYLSHCSIAIVIPGQDSICC